MVPLFTVAIFVAAFLLFLIQPLAARLILPQLGGSPAVWTGTMMFFQVLLLGGYAYAHGIERLAPRTQGIIHAALMLSCVLFLPLGLPGWWAPDMGPPLAALLVALLGGVGLPFLAISATSPLLQSWFARTPHPRARDPYFMYAASNAGSLLGLLAYPLVVERLLGLKAQGWAWSIGFAAAVVLVMGSWAAAGLWRKGTKADPPAAPAKTTPDAGRVTPTPPKAARSARGSAASRRAGATPASSVPASQSAGVAPASAAAGSPWTQRLIWIALAAAPSSLSLGVTQFLTTDVAAVPMLWVMPLGIYLLTYIVAFSKRAALGERIGRIMLPLATVAATAAIMVQASSPLVMVGSIHLLVLVAAGLACHGRLAALRPEASRLTEFYLLASLGGAVGGAFNALVAPLVFSVVLEYPLAIACCCALLAVRPARTPRVPRRDDAKRPRFEAIRAWAARQPRLLRLLLPLAAAVGASIYLVLADITLALMGIDSGRVMAGALSGRDVVVAATVGVPLLVAYILHRYRFAFAAIIATLAGQATIVPFLGARLSYDITRVERSFFGVCMVMDRQEFMLQDGPRVPPLRILRHGTTTHGQQFVDPVRRRDAISYYSRNGPVGSAFDRLDQGPRAVATVGLGAGSMAAYGRPGDQFDFFEIDPTVVRLAQDPQVFTYLSDSQARIQVILGDGRLRMAQQEAGRYDMILLDAFSSDSIPVHLLTREAFQTYVSRLKPAGVLLVHISNMHFELLDPVARIGSDLGLHIAHRADAVPNRQMWVEAILSSHWVALTRDPAVIERFGPEQGWERVRRPDSRPPWTDDHANVLESLQIRW